MKSKKSSKKLIAGIFLIFALTFLIVPVKKVQASDGWGTCGSNITWYFHDNSGWLEIKGTGDMPESGGDAWRSYGGKTKKVTISSGITSIGKEAFFGYKNLVSVTLPESIRTIGAGAFCRTGFKTINLPEGLKSIEYMAFYNSSLTSVKIPNSTTYLANSAFESSHDLKTVTLGPNLKSIGESCFAWTGLTSIKFPASVYFIGSHAFAHSALKSVVVPATVTSVKNSAFFDCGNLRYAEFYGSCEVPTDTFSGCGNLNVVKFGPKVTYIRQWVMGGVYTSSGRTLHLYITSPQTELPKELSIYRDYYIYAVKGSKAWEYCGRVERANFVDCTSSSGIKAWKAAVTGTKTYKVTFSSSGKTVETKTIAHGKKVEAPKNPQKKGYIFGGWYNGNKKYNFNSPVKANLTLKAKWTKVTVGKENITGLSNPTQNKVNVKFKKVTGSRGYEVQYSYTSNFKNKVVRYAYQPSYTFYGLRNRIVYVRVRAYKVDSVGNTIYGAFSSVKKVKIRK